MKSQHLDSLRESPGVIRGHDTVLRDLCRGRGDRGARHRDLLAGRYAVLPFDSPVAVVFGKLAAELCAAGKPRPTVGLMIAATARAQGLIVATLNERDCAGLPQVVVEDWSQPAASGS